MRNKVIFVLLGIAISLLLAINSVSALGVRPGSYEMNYHPNEKRVVEFDVIEGDPTRKIDFSAEGDFAQYVTLDKNLITGSGEVTATINLPSKAEKVGLNKLYIIAKEQPLQNQFVGTAVSIRVVIRINVPYPGKYIESFLNIPDANLGQEVPIELKVYNRGTENVTVNPVINFYDSSKIFVDTFTFIPVQISPGDYDYFRRYLNTDNLLPDNYLAEALIDYGGLKQKVNATFKVGNLYVNVTDFTKNMTAEEINKFVIGVQSNWNGNIQGVYADVRISNDTFETTFRTPQIELNAWEESNITGYFEAKGLKGGNYKVDITLNYLGHTTFATGDLVVIGKNKFNIPLIAGSIIGGLAILIAIYFTITRLKKSKHKRRR